MNHLTAGLIVVIALLGGFYGGFRYESAKVVTAAAAAKPATPAGANGRTGTGTVGTGGFGAGSGAGFAGGGRGSAGTISNLTATGFTLHSANGTDTKVTFAPNATVRKTVAGALGDLSESATVTVTVTGTRDSGGNLAATMITIVTPASPSPGG